MLGEDHDGQMPHILTLSHYLHVLRSRYGLTNDPRDLDKLNEIRSSIFNWQIVFRDYHVKACRRRNALQHAFRDNGVSKYFFTRGDYLVLQHRRSHCLKIMEAQSCRQQHENSYNLRLLHNVEAIIHEVLNDLPPNHRDRPHVLS